MRTSLKVCAMLILFLWMLVFEPAPVAHACEYNLYNTTNYWFKQNYMIDDALMPKGVQVEIRYDRDPILGQFKFKLEEGGEIYVVGLEDPASVESERIRSLEITEDFLSQHHIIQITQEYTQRLFYTPLYVSEPESVFANENQPFIEDRPIPDPHVISLFLVQDSNMLEIPVEVSYEPNPDFEIDRLISGETTSLENIVKSSDAILIGRANSNDQELSSEGYVFGNAEITVSTWLKGTGSSIVTLGPFGSGGDCLEILKLDTDLIFFTRKGAGQYHLVGTTTSDISPRSYSELNVKDIKKITGIEPVSVVVDKLDLSEGVEVDDSEITKSETSSLDEPPVEIVPERISTSDSVGNVSLGVVFAGFILLLITIGSIVLLIRRNYEN